MKPLARQQVEQLAWLWAVQDYYKRESFLCNEKREDRKREITQNRKKLREEKHKEKVFSKVQNKGVLDKHKREK